MLQYARPLPIPVPEVWGGVSAHMALWHVVSQVFIYERFRTVLSIYKPNITAVRTLSHLLH